MVELKLAVLVTTKIACCTIVTKGNNFWPSSVQVKFKSISVPVQLGTETGLIITVRPTHPPTPDKYIASTQEAEIWYAR